jgi:pantetheine-phosphate adenylyltransferase
MSDLHRRGLVALSADPITFGHLDLIKRSAAMCHELVVLVAENERKKGSYAFRLEERVEMTERAVAEAGIPDVRVIGSSGLLVDVYLREGCNCLFRGVRNDKDLDYEEEQTQLNQLILPSLQIEYLKASEQLRLVSSTTAKGFVSLYLDADDFVPMFVKQSLEERLLGQYRIAVTGGIAVGKSWVAAELVRQARKAGHEATLINVDQLLRDVYDEQSDGAELIRAELASLFGADVLSSGGSTVDRKRMAGILFRPDADAERQAVMELTMPHVARKYRQELAGVKGLVVVEWAQLAEMDMGPWTNNNVVIVDSPDRAEFIARRRLDPQRIAVMDAIQMPAMMKLEILQARAEQAHSGSVLTHANLLHANENGARDDVAHLFSKVKQVFPGLFAAKP